MGFFDQPYYALTKSHMSRIGIWPEQSKYVRIIRPLTALALGMTILTPRLTRFNDVWGETEALIHDIPILLGGIAILVIMLRFFQHFDQVKLLFENMERHWGMLKNTSAVVVLDKYAERGRCIVVVYTMHIYIEMILYWSLCLSPVILDVIDPLNETRTKIYIFHTEHGVDKDNYYWLILVHECIVTMVGMTVVIGLETVYFTWVVHACALFEVVAFNLKLVSNSANKENDVTRRNDRDYKQICECITAHEMAISFAELIESICNGPFATALSFLSIMIVFTGVQALVNSKRRNVLIQSAAYAIGQILHLYLNTIPGQELMNHSQKIHTTTYDLDWQDMSVRAQKLLIPILIRSNKPCCFTARKVYVVSMESFGSTIRTVMSYFTIFAQMI